MKIIISSFLFFILSFSSYSQELNTFIIKTTRFLPVQKLEKVLGLEKGNDLRVIFGELNLYSLDLNENIDKSIARIENNDVVDFIERDEILVQRKVPNDIGYSKQYSLEQIKVNELWDFTTGGLTNNGDTIVIAILEGGCDIFHDDLFDNIWRNKGEIPNDSIDNDGNGYIDDYYGVNIKNKNGKHLVMEHGTSVAGIIGAVGNNSIGIAGINWNVKLLPITDILAKSRIIEGYNYAYRLRKKYNETNGNDGAYIVCVNFSGGTPKPQFPEDSEKNMQWCEVYDKLGEVGILSVVSTDNDARDVEIEGDMPTNVY